MEQFSRFLNLNFSAAVEVSLKYVNIEICLLETQFFPSASTCTHFGSFFCIHYYVSLENLRVKLFVDSRKSQDRFRKTNDRFLSYSVKLRIVSVFFSASKFRYYTSEKLSNVFLTFLLVSLSLLWIYVGVQTCFFLTRKLKTLLSSATFLVITVWNFKDF